MEIGLLTAFLGGALAILSPCAALLLPAFFASTVGSGPKLIVHGLVFYLGLLLVLVPLGVGVGALGTLFVAHRTLIIGLASGLLITFGLMMIFGVGFDAARLLPGAQAAQSRVNSSVGLLKSFLLGATSGLAGFCAGPILGAVLTMAATQRSIVMAGTLLAVYAAGMVVPLMLIAYFWNRMGEKGRRVLRGRTFTFLGHSFHSTSVVAGVLMIGVGIIFWTTNGLVTMPSILPESVSAWLQNKIPVLSSLWIDVSAIVLVAALIIFLWWRAGNKTAPPPEEEPRTPSGLVEVSGVVSLGSNERSKRND